MKVTETIYYCVTVADATVGPEVLRMRVSRSGNLVDAGGHGRWPAGGHSLGRDKASWPTLHETQEAAAAELFALSNSCRHQWQCCDDERMCRRCGCIETMYCSEDV